MSEDKDFCSLPKAEIVLSTPAFVLTKESILLSDDTKINLSDIAFVYIQDNKNKVNTGRGIAIAIVSIAIFIYDYIRQGYVNMTALFLATLVIAVIIFVVTLGERYIALKVKTFSGEEHAVTVVNYHNITFEDVHYWRGIISATVLAWRQK